MAVRDREKPNPTEEAVWRICDKLHRMYENPTFEAVRKELGGGSATTLHKYIGSWRTTRKGEAAPAISALPVNVSSAMEELWRMALSAALAATDSEVKSQKGTIERLEHEVRRLAADLDEKSKANDSFSAKVVELDGRVMDLGNRLAAEQSVSQERLEALNRLQAQYNDLLHTSDQQLTQAVGERKQAQDALSGERERFQEREKKHSEALAAVEKKLSDATQQFQKDKNEWTKQQTKLELQLEAAREARDQLDSEKQNMEEALVEERADRLRLAESVASLTAELNSARNTLAIAQAEIATLRGEISRREKTQEENALRLGELQGSISELRKQLTQQHDAGKG